MRRAKVIIDCQYCGKRAEKVNTKDIYGVDYGEAYLCKNCNAYVGIHKGTTTPKGTLANHELRQWRIKAHNAFDPLWKGGTIGRKKAYEQLAREMGKEVVHIGRMTIAECKEVILAIERGAINDL